MHVHPDAAMAMANQLQPCLSGRAFDWCYWSAKTSWTECRFMRNEVAIGNLLMSQGTVDAAGLSRARQLQEKEGTTLGKAIAILGLADEQQIAVALAKGLQLEALGSELPEVPGEVVCLLPAEFCRKRRVAPLSLQGKALRLALEDPLDYSMLQDAEFLTGKRIVAVVSTDTQIQSLIRQIYPAEVPAQLTTLPGGDVQGEVETVGDTEIEVVDPAKLAKDTKMPPVVRLVNLILSGAAKAGASDIHMEPKETHLQVRYRVDGLLSEVVKVHKTQMDATISRMKIISGMDIADRRRPQDGRSRLKYEGKRIDLRVSTLPTQFGEKVVIRLLDSKRAQITMEQLGLTAENQRIFQLMLSRPQGMILVTGPTGSGKSSTLYTALNWVKSPTKNIITVEDPIEYQLDGINQVQINTKAGVTFAAGLRSILRQDPNIILVGEIRDQETAGIALEAAQTGHLLLSTLHTNDAPGTISRLLDLGIEPFLISSAVIGILAQRLVRTPCPYCKLSKPPSADAIEKAGGVSRLPADPQWVAVGSGCDACQQTGSKGRRAIHELLVVNDEVRELISRRAPEHAIRKAARNAGMRTLVEDGILKAAQGLTTLEDVVRVVSADDSSTHKEESTRPDTGNSSAALDYTASDNHQPRGLADLKKPAVSQLDSECGNNHPAQDLALQVSDLSDHEPKQRVLVVEDSPTIASVVKYFLELEGFEVLLAKDGEAGLEAAQNCQPDVIVTDYNMPGMDGMAMVKAIRVGATTRGIAVLMLTSEDSIEKEASALEAGVDDYILKPVEPRRLAARVKSVLARSQRKNAALVQ
jgi:type IV pilus assembly protein PilB